MMNEGLFIADHKAHLTKAIQSSQLNVRVTKFRREAKVQGKIWDASVSINGQTVLIEIKLSVEPSDVINLPQPGTVGEPVLIMADYITPKSKVQLVEMGYNYLDRAGNIHLKLENLSIHREGNKNIAPTNTYKDHAFTKTGAKVVFQLLHGKNRHFPTQRQLAKWADVSVGAVNKAIDQLKRERFITTAETGGWKIIRYDELLEKWSRIATRLLFKEGDRYRTIGRDPHTFMLHGNVQPGDCWGGEAGAELHTGRFIKNHQLTASSYVLYSRLQRPEMMKNYKLAPDLEGGLTVRKPFWTRIQNQDDQRNDDLIAPPLLLYAELLITGDSRNLETAKLILQWWNEHE